MNPIVLTTGDMLVAAALIVTSSALSFLLSLGLQRALLVSAVRMAVRLRLSAVFCCSCLAMRRCG